MPPPGTPSWLPERRWTFLPSNSIWAQLAVDSGLRLHVVWMDDRTAIGLWNDIYYLSWL